MNERTYIVCFTEPIHLVCEVRRKTYVFFIGQYKTRTADYCGLRTGYKIRTRYKTRTGKYVLGIKRGQGIKRGLRTTDYGLGMKYGLRTTHFAHFGLESCMVFEAIIASKTTGACTGAYMNRRIYRFILNE